MAAARRLRDADQAPGGDRPLTASHLITVVCEGAEIGEWSGYHIESSMITPADSFELRRPFDAASWNLLRRDARITVRIDGTSVLDGFIDKREKHSRQGTMVVQGRDRVGRLVDESAPALNYNGLTIQSAVESLMRPWFSTLTFSAARDRNLRRSRGRRVAAGNEPTVPVRLRTPRRGIVHPGMSRWQVIQEIASSARCIVYSAGDGRELIFGKPNYSQAPQYLFIHADPRFSGLTSNVKDLVFREDDGDRYSMIMVAGTGGQGDTNYGEGVVDKRGVVFDSPFNRIDGTGRDFIHPKRLFMPERDFESYGDAQRVAANEQARRDFRRHIASVEAPLHGQFVGSAAATLFTPNTIARIIDNDFLPALDDLYLIVSCNYNSDREQGEYTNMTLVPLGTEIIL